MSIFIGTVGCEKERNVDLIKVKDMPDRVFGNLTVVYKLSEYAIVDSKRQRQWYCRCDCGAGLVVLESDLLAGIVTACQKCEKKQLRNADLTGRVFDRLTVIGCGNDYVAPSGYHIKRWRCQCECGNEFDVRASTLLNGRATSCGCRRKEIMAQLRFDDLEGRRFDNLWVSHRVADYVSPSGYHHPMWHCVCDCGNEFDMLGYRLRSGDVTSCGCSDDNRRKSVLEQRVIQYFDNLHFVLGVDYVVQKTYSDLVGVGGGRLRYDFLMYQNGRPYRFIECQGKQHYISIDYFGGDVQFEYQKQQDCIKREYAEKIGVPLIEIPYTADTYEKVVAILQEHGI